MKAATPPSPRIAALHPVAVGQLAVTAERSRAFVAHGLGSGVVLCLRDAHSGAAGMAHIMLPSAPSGARTDQPARFADLALPALLAELDQLQVDRTQLVAKIAGGAQLFGGQEQAGGLAIGQRTVERVKLLLQAHDIPLTAEETGGQAGRTVVFVAATGKMLVKSIGSGERIY